MKNATLISMTSLTKQIHYTEVIFNASYHFNGYHTSLVRSQNTILGGFSCRLPKPEKEEMKVLLPEQIGVYLKEVERRGYLELTIGLRLGELLALLWTDLDVNNMTISVNKQVIRFNGELRISRPKTSNSIRTGKAGM